MSVVVDFLKKSGIQYFSTVGLDGKPKVRPFQFMMEDGGKVYYCTANTKNVFAEMAKNPWIEICASVENFSWMRLSGKAAFTDDAALKARVLDASPLVKSIYRTPDNPAFELFWLDEAKAVIADFSGNPPVSYSL